MVQLSSPANRGKARPSSFAFRLRRNMRSEAAVIAAALVLALAGCASHAKPMAASPPGPLPVPQTHVTLPPPQPLDPDALASETDVKPPEAPPLPPAPAAPAES